MHLNWLWQSLFARGVAALLALAGAIVLAVLKKRASSWATPALYGLGGFTLIAASIMALSAISALPQQEPVTPETVEISVRTWCDVFGLNIRREPSEAASYFSFVITLQDGSPVTVSRIRERDRYLMFTGKIAVSLDHAAAIAKLSKDQQIRLTDELALELARSQLGFTIIGTPVQGVVLAKSVPIGSSLTEDGFARHVDEIDRGIILAREAIRLALDRSGFIMRQ